MFCDFVEKITDDTKKTTFYYTKQQKNNNFITLINAL